MISSPFVSDDMPEREGYDRPAAWRCGEFVITAQAAGIVSRSGMAEDSRVEILLLTGEITLVPVEQTRQPSGREYGLILEGLCAMDQRPLSVPLAMARMRDLAVREELAREQVMEYDATSIPSLALLRNHIRRAEQRLRSL